MVISQATEYAIRSLLHLASAHQGEIVAKRDICHSQGVTPGFLIKIMQPLIAAGLVTSHRGVKGGFTLGRTANQISLWDIIEAEEGQIFLNKCLIHEGYCERDVTCPVHQVWLRARQELEKILRQNTLADLVKRM